MPRVSEIDDPRGDPTLSELFAKERAIYGGDLLNPTKVMAHCPPILRAAKLLSASIAESGTLPKGLAALVSLRVAAINGCPF
jgi:alkylhydroperoxidase family enzyme